IGRRADAKYVDGIRKGLGALSSAPTGYNTLAQANGLGVTWPRHQALKGRHTGVESIASPLQGWVLSLFSTPRALPSAKELRPVRALQALLGRPTSHPVDRMTGSRLFRQPLSRRAGCPVGKGAA